MKLTPDKWGGALAHPDIMVGLLLLILCAIAFGIDLPPRTSPPSMLDPGPFEVHSKG